MTWDPLSLSLPMITSAILGHARTPPHGRANDRCLKRPCTYMCVCVFIQALPECGDYPCACVKLRCWMRSTSDAPHLPTSLFKEKNWDLKCGIWILFALQSYTEHIIMGLRDITIPLIFIPLSAQHTVSIKPLIYIFVCLILNIVSSITVLYTVNCLYNLQCKIIYLLSEQIVKIWSLAVTGAIHF